MICVQLVGLPGSGKTVYRKQMTEGWIYEMEDPLVVSIDDFIHEHRGDLSYGEAFTRYIEEAMIYNAGIIADAAKNHLPIIIDKTNLTRHHRMLNYEALPDHVHHCFHVYCPKHIRDKRLAQRSDQIIPAHVLTMMERKYQMPNMIEEPFFNSVFNWCNDYEIEKEDDNAR